VNFRGLPQIELVSSFTHASGFAEAKAAPAASPSEDTNTTTTPAATAESQAPTTAAQDQTVQHPQAEASATAPAATIRAGNDAVPQAQPIPSTSAVHDATPSDHRTDVAGSSSRPAEGTVEAQTADSPATAGISAATIIRSMNQSEIWVGMHSVDFGQISIRTAVTQNQMTAAISVDHSELSKAISAQIPTIQHKLGGELGLKALVEENQGTTSFSGESRHSSHREEGTSHPDELLASDLVSTGPDLSVFPAQIVAADVDRLDVTA
jgi:hypothetical protein